MHAEIKVFMNMAKALQTTTRIDLTHSCSRSDEIPLKLQFDWSRDTESGRAMKEREHRLTQAFEICKTVHKSREIKETELPQTGLQSARLPGIEQDGSKSLVGAEPSELKMNSIPSSANHCLTSSVKMFKADSNEQLSS